MVDVPRLIESQINVNKKHLSFIIFREKNSTFRILSDLQRSTTSTWEHCTKPTVHFFRYYAYIPKVTTKITTNEATY